MNQRRVDRLGVAGDVVGAVLDSGRRGKRERARVDGAVRLRGIRAVGCVDDLGDARAADVGRRQRHRHGGAVEAGRTRGPVAANRRRGRDRVDLQELAVRRFGVAGDVEGPVLDGRSGRRDGERARVDVACRRRRSRAVGRVADLRDTRAAAVVGGGESDRDRPVEPARAARVAVTAHRRGRGDRVDLDQLAVGRLGVTRVVVGAVLDRGRRRARERARVDGAVRLRGVRAVGCVDDLGDAGATTVGRGERDRDRGGVVARSARGGVAPDRRGRRRRVPGAGVDRDRLAVDRLGVTGDIDGQVLHRRRGRDRERARVDAAGRRRRSRAVGGVADLGIPEPPGLSLALSVTVTAAL